MYQTDPLMSAVHTVNRNTWSPESPTDQGADLACRLESGNVLHFPNLNFIFRENERQFLDARWSNGSAKNISLAGDDGHVKGASGPAEQVEALGALIARYRVQASELVRKLFPKYGPRLRLGRTSYRPVMVQGRPTSWRKDDSRLHVDAFPSRPTHGERILRVFANVNPNGMPRVWRVGEPFEEMAKRLLPRASSPVPGVAWFLYAVRATKSMRRPFDHYMLQLHDEMKRDLEYQRSAPQETVEFMPGSVWMCFSDQASHAAMSGQFMFEQTMHLPVEALYEPERSPLRTLERLTGRKLV